MQDGERGVNDRVCKEQQQQGKLASNQRTTDMQGTTQLQ